MIETILTKPIEHKLYVEMLAIELSLYAERMADNNEQTHEAREKALEAARLLTEVGVILKTVYKISQPPLKQTWLSWFTMVLFMLCLLILGGVVGLLIS